MIDLHGRFSNLGDGIFYCPRCGWLDGSRCGGSTAERLTNVLCDGCLLDECRRRGLI